jgi:hypothetical protein
MQNRYVADIGDYVKLAILRHLAPGKKLGVAWWLFPDESHNADGGHREYLKRSNAWKRFDPDLFEALLKIEKGKERDVRVLENPALLPNAVFAGDPVPCGARPFAKRPDERRLWLRGIQGRFKDRDLLFFDPDNGIASEGLRPTQRRAGKSAFIGEIKELKESHRAIVIYHHHSMFKGGHEAELRSLAGRLNEGGFRVSGALRAKPWSPRAFFILDGDDDFVLERRISRKTGTDGSSGILVCRLDWEAESSLL